MENQDLLRRIEALEKWKAEKTVQQVSYPLDFQSINVLNNYFMHIVDTLTTVGGASGNEETSYIGRQGNLEFIVSKNSLYPYTVNTSTEVITTTAYLENDMRINVQTTDTPPSPLVAGVDYFVINSTGTSFQISATLGGAAINITSTGIGRQFLLSVGF